MAPAEIDRPNSRIVGFVDRTGTFALTSPAKSSGSAWAGVGAGFVGGLALVRQEYDVPPGSDPNGAFYFIDKTGSQAFSGYFESATNFSEGVALVEIANNGDPYWEIIDEKGRTLAKLLEQIVSAEDFDGQLARVTFYSKTWGYVNHAGVVVWHN